MNKVIAGVVTTLYSWQYACHDGVSLRANVWGSIFTFSIDDHLQVGVSDSSITSGQPGIGALATPAGNSVSVVGLGPEDRISPQTPDILTFNTSITPTRVDVRFPGTPDDANGTGVALYQWYRDGQWIANSSAPEFGDQAVTPGSTHSYSVNAQDYHLSVSGAASFTITTPPAGSVDPRRVGIRPTGAYWGAAPEVIDVLSGNLNYSIPLLKAQGRGGWGVGLNLSYNSQNWRLYSNRAWNLGSDVGYGYGWRLMAGALTPYWIGSWAPDHYIFADASGTEYRLDQNTNGVWTSRESIYVSYDSNANRLYFPDGSFWVMGCTSAGNENDAGTMYPTIFEDSNGNQIGLRYYGAVNFAGTNSSSRIQEIEDVRATLATDGYSRYRTYSFAYDGTQHLVSVQNSIGTAEGYTFSFAPTQALTSPFSSQAFPGGLNGLASITISGIAMTYGFVYDGSGEMTQATLPYGGYPARTYNSTYLNSSPYLSRNIYNRLSTATVTDGTATVTLATNTYDQTALANVTGQREWDGGYSSITTRGDLTTSVTPTETRTLSYDLTGNVTGTTVNGVTTSVTTNGNTNYAAPATVTQATTNGNAQETLAWTSFLGLTNDTNPNSASVSTVYDAYARPSSTTTSPLGMTTTYTYNSAPYNSGNPPTVTATVNGRWSKTTLDGLGRTIKLETGNGTTTVSQVDTVYDSCGCSPSGKMVQQSPPHAPSATPVWTTYTYDGLGRTLAAATVGSDTQGKTTYVYQGNTVKPTDPAGKWKKFTMDAFGSLTQVNEPNPGGGTAPITIYNTGVTTGTTLAADGSIDAHYTLISSADPAYPGPSAKVVTANAWPIPPWVSDGPNSKWIGPRTDAGGSGYNSVGNYTYRTTFDLTGRDPSTATLTGSMAADDSVTVQLNGNVVASANGFSSFTSFTISSGFIAGVNTLDFVVNNAGSSPNPTGLRVEISGTAAISGGAGGDYVTTYSYDVLNHLTVVSMPRPVGTQPARTFNYTVNGVPGGLLRSATNPENGTVSYTYDGNNRLATKVDAKNQKVQYSYDLLGRLSQVQRYPSGSPNPDPCQGETYSYDFNWLDYSYSAANTLGRLAAVQYKNCYGPSGTDTYTESYSYKSNGLPVGKRLQLTRSSQPYNLDGTWSYDGEGRITQVAYPQGTQTYNYVYDNMGRLFTMGNNSYNANLISNTVYTAANQVQSITAVNPVNGESRIYNTVLQMTRLTVTGYYTGTQLDVQYNYPATGNNGQIQSQTDMKSPSGEQVTYTYDALKRLASATDQNGTNWSQTFNYDGFGNLTTVGGAGGAPGMQIAVDPATNRIQVGVSYDANGNDLSNGASYDIENRLLQTTFTGRPTINYAYAAGNKRIWRGITGQLDEVAFYSVTGQKLATYNLVTQGSATQFVMAGQNVYFGGKLVAKGVSPNVTNLQPVAADRLGSIGKFYPYGQEINPTQGPSTEKFTGYFRDVETGLDYADQRYYEFSLGRFTSPDRYVASGGPGDPGSWNQYAYVQGDPINYTDRRGLRRDDDNDWDWGYGLIPSFSFGGGAHSIVLDWLNIAYGLCDDGEKGTAFREVVRPCIQAELLLLAAQAGKAPACWQNAGKVDQTLGDLGSNIMEISGMNISDSSHLAGLDSLIHSTIVSEMATLLGSIASGSKGPPAFYVGGHFNLDLDQNAIGTTLGDDFGAFTGAFGGFIDGTRQYANLAEGNYTLHSKQNVGGSFDFHFDIYNPLSGNPLDAIGHLFGDVIGGHIGSPCLDPAWQH